MNKIEESQKILKNFLSKLEAKRLRYAKMRQDNPDFIQVSEKYLNEELDRCWIYFTDHIGKILAAPLPTYCKKTPASQLLAIKLYTEWQSYIETSAEPESLYSEYFCNSNEFPRYGLQPPKKKEILDEYLRRLGKEITLGKAPLHLKERCLRSFLDYLRNNLTSVEIAFLEHIFPAEMEIRESYGYDWGITKKGREQQKVPRSLILRRVQPQEYPIPIKTAAAVLERLSDRIITGRPNSKQTSAEVLGLCWLCLTAARLRLPVEVKDLRCLSPTCLNRAKSDTLPTINLPTLFGELAVPISNYLWNFLATFPGKNALFQATEPSLYRTLKSVIWTLPSGMVEGKITFATFLASPHEC